MTEEAKLADEVKALIIRRLKLENLRPADIADEAPLFTTSDGGTEGMGLDSIDALELVLGVEQSFGVRPLELDSPEHGRYDPWAVGAEVV